MFVHFCAYLQSIHHKGIGKAGAAKGDACGHHSDEQPVFRELVGKSVAEM